MNSRRHLEILKSVVRKSERKIALVVLDGVAGYRTTNNPVTELEAARTPSLDRLARRGSLGRVIPAIQGLAVGSGPGHLGLFGYDPTDPMNEIGRGVLEAVGIDYPLKKHEISGRGSFVTLDRTGAIVDLKGGGITDGECKRVCARMQAAVAEPIDGVQIKVLPVRDHRFCIILDGEGLSSALLDTDPERTGVPPFQPRGTDDSISTRRTMTIFAIAVTRMLDAICVEPKANGFVLRGFSRDPGLENLQTRWGIRAAAIASQPLYRGVAKMVGMTPIPTGHSIADAFRALFGAWNDFDFFYVHIKKTDLAGEEGDRAGKIAAIEETDRFIESLDSRLDDVIVVTGDHATPPQMRAHSFHPVPLLIASPFCDVDDANRYTERESIRGSIGTVRACEVMQLALAHSGRLRRYGA